MSKKNSHIAISLICLVCSMLLLTFASAPIYSLFCKATGFAGTPAKAQVFYSEHGQKRIKIKFDANVDKKLEWRFKPKNKEITLKTGENALVFYESENLANKDIIGTSIYNITPQKAGQYFVKIHCFCYEEQLLLAGQKLLMPVSFYIDPAIEKDPYMQDVDTITLSYSLFKVKEIN